MITVMGATGRVGGAIVRRLLAKRVEVRAVGRSETAAAELAAGGAQVLLGDAGNPDFLSGAFAGADAAFTMLPFDPTAADYHAHQARLGEAIVTAVREAGVPRVILLSSIGADVPAGTGVLTGLHELERRVGMLRHTHVQVLRPGAFFENLLPAVPAIEHEGAYADVFAPHAGIPMIAARDVAAAAVEALITSGWSGHRVRELPGPRDLTYAEATRIIGAQVGRPGAAYVQLPAHRALEALAAYGFSPDAAQHYVEFARALESGLIRAREGRGADSTAGTRFEAFAAEFAAREPA